MIPRPALLPLIAVISLTPTLTRAQDSIEEAKRLLALRREQDVRQGAAICTKLNNEEAADALLEVLNQVERVKGRLHPAHYRDIVWDALLTFTAPEAQLRVLRELTANRQNAFVRQWCVELLGAYVLIQEAEKDPPGSHQTQFGPAIVKALRDPDPGVRRWAARSAGWVKPADADRNLERLARDKKRPYLRSNAIEALARIAPAIHKDRFLEAVSKDKDGGVRCALLGALPEIYPDEVERQSLDSVEDEDWRPRLQAVENLAELRTRSAVDGLVLAVADERPRIASTAVEHLQSLTGYGADDFESWKRWWQENREGFVFEKKPKAEEVVRKEEKNTGVVEYNGIRLVSDHAAFLIDKSLKMEDMLISRSLTKSEAALKELDRTLKELLDREFLFNVYIYNEEIAGLSSIALRLNDKNRKMALRFVHKTEEEGQKDIWQVLRGVLQDPQLDTAYLLSSGEPDVGTYVHWNRVTSHLKDLNRFQKVVVHTIAYSDSQWYRDQLEKIAQATGGQFRWFE